MEFLVTMTTQVSAGMSENVVAEVRRCEGAHSRDLAEQVCAAVVAAAGRTW